MSSPDMLTASNITKNFGGLTALGEVSASLLPGEIVGLIGPNGSGKTTLLNVISGAYPPTLGQVTVDGEEITGWPMHRIAHQRVARTFQHIRLFTNMTVLENVEVGATVRAAQDKQSTLREAALRSIRQVGLEANLHHKATTLDYGAQRRLEIARALVSNPRYLLLDEPAAGMNEAESDDLMKTISQIREEHNMGILVIDHDLRMIMRLCDRIVVLNQGGVICEGLPEEVQTNAHVAEAYLGKRRGQSINQTALTGGDSS